MPSDQQRFGKYRLLRRIAAGGMGEVHLAKLSGPSGFEKLVVIKRLLENRRQDAKYVEMFFGEARVAAQLTHSNIVQIYETGEIDQTPYIAMEYVHGKSLRKILQVTERAPLPAALTAQMFVQLCRGLHFAHEARHLSGATMGLIHRDINPLNVLCSYQGEVKIIDFGIAKSELALDQTQAGTIKGTVVYMSPEQSLGQKLDRRSDLFSVGICLYEALTHHNPFHKGTLGASLEAIRKAAPPPIAASRPELAPFAPLLAKVLAARPDERLAHCGLLADALEELVASHRLPKPANTLGALLTRLFQTDMQNEEVVLEQTDLANFEDIARAQQARGNTRVLLPPTPTDEGVHERTVAMPMVLAPPSAPTAAQSDGQTRPDARLPTPSAATPLPPAPTPAPMAERDASGPRPSLTWQRLKARSADPKQLVRDLGLVAALAASVAVGVCGIAFWLARPLAAPERVAEAPQPPAANTASPAAKSAAPAPNGAPLAALPPEALAVQGDVDEGLAQSVPAPEPNAPAAAPAALPTDGAPKLRRPTPPPLTSAKSARPSLGVPGPTNTLRVRADPPLTLRHNGEVAQNPIALHAEEGLLEFRSGPGAAGFAVQVHYEVQGSRVDLVIDAQPWAEISGAGGLKLGRTPLRMEYVGDSTLLMLQNPHVPFVQHLTLKLRR